MSTENTNTAVAEEIPNLLITPSAQEYLHDLLTKQNTPGIGVRIFVEHPGTPRAECCMAYSAPEEVIPTDYKQDYPDFPAYIDAPSIPYLLDAVIDYNKDRFGGQLTFRAPNSKVPRVGPMLRLKNVLLTFFKQKLTQVLQGMAEIVVW